MSNPKKLEIHRGHWAAIVGALELIRELGLPPLVPGHVDVEPPGDYGVDPNTIFSGMDVDHFTVHFVGTDPNETEILCRVIVEEKGLPKMAWLQYYPDHETPSLDLEAAPMPFAHFQEDGSIEFDDVEKFRDFFDL